MGTKAEIKKLRVPDLRRELAARNLNSTGTKSVLMERLERALEAEGQLTRPAKKGAKGDKSQDEAATVDVAAEEGPPSNLVDVQGKMTQQQQHQQKGKVQEAAGGGIDRKRKNQEQGAVGFQEKENGAAGTSERAGRGALAEVVVDVKGTTQSAQHPQDKFIRKAIIFDPKPAENKPKELVMKTSDEPASEADKRKERAKRFGVFDADVEAEKKKLRAKRFGMVTQEDEVEKKKVRAKRFGIPIPEEEEEKKKKRAKRFGIVTQEDEAAKKMLRAKRFGIVTPEIEDEKKKARAARFGLNAPRSGLSEKEKMKKRADRFAAG